MFCAISKEMFWNAIDHCPRLKPDMGLKFTQDVTTLSHMMAARGKRICEAGGGNSRILDFLCAQNECWNVDAMEGRGNGEIRLQADPRITQIKSYLGNYDDTLPDAYFDFVFSISVVEHVGETDLSDFFADSARVLRPGGIMLHAVDLYLPDSDDPTPHTHSQHRVARYKAILDGMADVLQWHEPDKVDPPFCASARFASNTDLTLHSWNRVVPQLKDVRSKSQSCSLLIIMRRSES